MRILFSSLTGYGHFLQLIPLARAARAGGHEVVFATGSQRHSLLAGAGLEVAAAGRSTDEVVGQAAREVRAENPDFDELPTSRTIELISARFTWLMPQSFVDDLVPIIERFRADLVVHGAYCPGAGLAARVAGVPALCHGTGRARTEDGKLMGPAGDILRQYAKTLDVDLPDTHPMFLGHTYLDICPPSLQDPQFLATADRHELRLVPFSPPAPMPAWVGERASDRPLVFLSMGTESDSVEMLRHAIDGLSTLDVDVLVATGRLDVDAIGAVPANVHVESWVPQADLLPHVDLVVHHGGSGTTFGSMSAGRPQLFLQNRPGPDQLLNADMVCGAGAGERLLFEEISAEAVAARAKLLLGEADRRAAARDIADEIAGMASPEDVARRLPELANG